MQVQSTISRKATVWTEESGRGGEVAVMGR